MNGKFITCSTLGHSTAQLPIRLANLIRYLLCTKKRTCVEEIPLVPRNVNIKTSNMNSSDILNVPNQGLTKVFNLVFAEYRSMLSYIQ